MSSHDLASPRLQIYQLRILIRRELRVLALRRRHSQFEHRRWKADQAEKAERRTKHWCRPTDLCMGDTPHRRRLVPVSLILPRSAPPSLWLCLARVISLPLLDFILTWHLESRLKLIHQLSSPYKFGFRHPRRLLLYLVLNNTIDPLPANDTTDFLFLASIYNSIN